MHSDIFSSSKSYTTLMCVTCRWMATHSILIDDTARCIVRKNGRNWVDDEEVEWSAELLQSSSWHCYRIHVYNSLSEYLKRMLQKASKIVIGSQTINSMALICMEKTQITIVWS